MKNDHSYTLTMRGEIRKLASYRGTWIALSLSIVGSAFTAGTLAARNLVHGPISPVTALPYVHSNLLSEARAAIIGEYAAAIFGVLVGTVEWKSRTWTSTLTLEPRRARIVSSKLLAVILGGAIIASLSLIAAGVTASLWIPASDHPFSQANLPGGPTLSDLWAQVLRTAPAMIAATVLIAILWTALGFLLKRQTLAVAIAIVYPLGISRLIAATVPNLARWLPEWAAQGIAQPPSAAFPLSFSNVASGVKMAYPLSLGPAIGDVVIIVCILLFAAVSIILRADFT